MAAADPCVRGPRRFLATVDGGSTPVLVRSRETVELVCRPANDDGCRWTGRKGDILSDQCVLATTGPGVFWCKQGDTLVGKVELKESGDRIVYPYRSTEYGYSHRSRSRQEQEVERERYEKAHMCTDTGKLIDRSLLCDGRRDCGNGEDESSCALSCGAPALAEGSLLTSPASQLYPHGASVAYTCPPGHSFRQTLGEYRRKCREGVWSGSPPACHQNLAFGRPGAASTGSAMGLGPRLAVDGQVSTWTMLTPSEGVQSLNVTLASGAAVDLVLVRTLVPSYEVALISGASRTECRCNRSHSEDVGLGGLGVCSCPAVTQSDPSGRLVLQILSTKSGLKSLSVSEIAAFEAPSPVSDQCALLDGRTHGHFERSGASGARLVCDEGYRASCAGETTCGAASSSVCRPVVCPPAPTIPRAVIAATNGTGWRSVAEYRCAAGYQPYPPEQRTVSVCGADGLWSISHLACLPESDLRVVALRLGRQHARSVAALGAELETLMAGQLKLLRQLEHTQRRLWMVEQLLNVNGQEIAEEFERLEAVEDRQQEVADMEEGQVQERGEDEETIEQEEDEMVREEDEMEREEEELEEEEEELEEQEQELERKEEEQEKETEGLAEKEVDIDEFVDNLNQKAKEREQEGKWPGMFFTM